MCRIFSSVLFLALLSSAAVAGETGLLERKAGSTETRMGVRVESVEDVAGSDQQKILVSLPADEGKKPPAIEEVVVTAPRSQPEIRERPRYEFIRDYAQGRYGFVIYLGSGKDLPFRISFSDPETRDPTTPAFQP